MVLFGYSVNAHIKKSNYYNINNIIIKGNKFLEEEKIKSIISDDTDMKNIFSLDFKKIQNKLHEDSFIYSSQVYTLFPSSLFIEINEIKPIGLCQIEGKTYFINYFSDKIEVDLKEDFKSINYYNIPTIIMNYENNFTFVEETQIKEVLKKIINNSNILFKSINEIESNKNNIKITLDKKTTLMLNNNKNLFNELEIMLQFYAQTQKQISIYQYIDFRIKDQIIVREKT